MYMLHYAVMHDVVALLKNIQYTLIRIVVVIHIHMYLSKQPYISQKALARMALAMALIKVRFKHP